MSDAGIVVMLFLLISIISIAIEVRRPFRKLR
jgi:hypothetical protein